MPLLTELSALLRRRREELRITQKKITEIVGTTTQFVSQWESGERKPPRGKLELVAEAYQIPIEKLRSLVDATIAPRIRESQRGAPEDGICLGFVHAALAAPVISLMALRQDLGSVQLTSFGEAVVEDSVESNDPHYHSAGYYREHGSFLEGPSFYKRGRSEIDWLIENKDSSALRPYTVAELCALILKEEPSINALVCAPEPIRKYKELLVNVARITTSYGGCSLIVAGTKNSSHLLPHSEPGKEPLDLQAFTKALSRKKVHILYPPGTIAYDHFQLLNEHVGHDKLDARPTDLSYWRDHSTPTDGSETSNGSAMKANRSLEAKVSDLLKNDALFGLLAFEPYVSWFESLLRRVGGGDATWFKKADTRSLLPAHARLGYTKYDLVFRRDTVRSGRHTEQIDVLLRWLAAAAHDLSAYGGDKTSEQVAVVSQYLSMDRETCSQTLSDCNFEVLMYPQWNSL